MKRLSSSRARYARQQNISSPLQRFFGQRFNVALIRPTTAAQNGKIEFPCVIDFVSCLGLTIGCRQMNEITFDLSYSQLI